MRNTLRACLFYLVSITACSGCGQTVTLENERARLQGTWEITDWEKRGIKNPHLVGTRLTFFLDGTVGQLRNPGEAMVKQKYMLNVDTNPRCLDWSVRTIMPDKSIVEAYSKGIYRLDGDQLTICMAERSSIPRPVASTTKGNDFIALMILKRVKTPEDPSQNATAAQQRAYQELAPFAHGDSQSRFLVDFHDRAWSRRVEQHVWPRLMALHDVRELRLRGCSGVGDDQLEHVGKLAALEVLDLHSTEVGNAGVARLGQLCNLTRLDLSFTSINDSGLATLARLERLQSVVLKGTLVTAKGVTALRAASKNLEVVWPRAYTKSQQEAAAMLSRRGLEVDDDWDTNVTPKSIACRVMIPGRGKVRASSVTAGDADQGQLATRPPSIATNEVASLLTRLPAPISVEAACAEMDDTIFACFQNVPGLIRLDLATTQVTDFGLAELKPSESLKVLRLSYAKRITDVGLASLESLKNLETLDLEGVSSTPAGLSPLLSLEHLRLLKVQRRQINRDFYAKFREKKVTVKMR